jgi:hypothetical protein
MRYRAFLEQFGRDPEPDEPLFFDPALEEPMAPEPAVIRAQVLAAAAAAGVDGRVVLRFMRLDRGTKPLEPAAAVLRWRLGRMPEPDYSIWLPGLPEEPSSK